MIDQIVDTNVAIVANDAVLTPDDPKRRSPGCVEACVDALVALTENGHLVLDSGGIISAQYHRYLSFAGQPGPGDIFMKWVHDNQWNATLCVRVDITPNGDRVFEEFPEALELEKFDRDDRVFIAVAIAHGGEVEILQGVDAKWRRWVTALTVAGVTVRFLCNG